jgi:hypothetical protein
MERKSPESGETKGESDLRLLKPIVYRSTVYCTNGTTCWVTTVEGVSTTAMTALVYYL